MTSTYGDNHRIFTFTLMHLCFSVFSYGVPISMYFTTASDLTCLVLPLFVPYDYRELRKTNFAGATGVADGSEWNASVS